MSTIQIMWLRVATALAVIVSMDIPWVMLNSRYGLYKGLVRGTVSNPAAVGALWLAVMLAEAVLIGYVISTSTSWWAALLSGAFIGFTVYFTFNATALVTFDTWPRSVAAVDTVWGAVMLGAAALVAHAAVGRAR